MMRARSAVILAAAVALAAGGCGGGHESTVTGVVTLDGRPLDRGTVSFIPAAAGGAGATATIGPGGAFEARTGSVAGLQPGEYVVTVQAREDVIIDPKGGLPMPGKLITPRQYESSSTSDLRATIEPGDNEVNLELHGHAA